MARLDAEMLDQILDDAQRLRREAPPGGEAPRDRARPRVPREGHEGPLRPGADRPPPADHPRGVRRPRRRGLRHLPGLRGHGRDRPRHRDRRPGHLPRHRPDQRRRHPRSRRPSGSASWPRRGSSTPTGPPSPRPGATSAPSRPRPTPSRRTGKVVAYRISGRKQWISNGGVADRYTILANAPGGPSWFLVDRDTEGFTCRQARGQARDPGLEHGRALPRERRRPRRPADRHSSRARGSPRPRPSSATRA